MNPISAFFIAVLFSEMSQLGTWKLGNPTKQWREWFRWGIPHFLSNFIIVMGVYLAWQAQVLDEMLAWCLTWFGYKRQFGWDELLNYNVVTGFILGGGTDFFADKFGYAMKLLLPMILKKVGTLARIVAELFKPRGGNTPTPGEGTP